MDADAYIAYSLPRMLSPAIQCSFLTYFFELYTGEFGWTHAEWGVLSSLYSRIQIGSFLLLGLIFFGIQSLRSGGVKGILVGGTITHWLTYVLLIFLPIKWHDIKTPYIDSILGKQSQFFRAMFDGPVALSSMAKTKGWYALFCIPWCFVKLFWVILYIPMKVFWIALHINSYKRNVTNITQLPSTVGYESSLTRVLPLLLGFESIHIEKINNFAMRMNRTRQFMGTRTFLIYLLTMANGVGMSMHEISNKALESYAFPGNDVGTAVNVNLSFFLISNLLIYTLFSLLKFYCRSKSFFSEIFYLLSIMFFVLGIPILPAFVAGTGDQTPPTGNNDPDKPEHWFILIALTIFHSTGVFLIFSGGPLTFYVGAFVLGGHKVLMSFSTLVLFGCLVGTSLVNTAVGAIYDNTAPDVNQNEPLNIVLNKTEAHRIIVTICVVGQSVTLLILYPHDWWWNKNNWFNYILMASTGVINSLFVGYTNLMLGMVTYQPKVKDKKCQWIFYGIFYGGTNFVVSFFMIRMFRSFGQDEMRSIGLKCVRFGCHYCFPTVYKSLTGLCIAANLIMLIPIWYPGWYDSFTGPTKQN